MVYANDSKSFGRKPLRVQVPPPAPHMKPKILVIVGPTASGKTSLSITLAKKHNGEIISADSRQVYTGLDIGTGKVTKKEMHGIPHHLLDVASARTTFTAEKFIVRGQRAIQEILARGKTPIIVGGTGFYIDALLGRIALADAPINSILRKKLEAKPVEKLFLLLQKNDPERAAQMDTPSERNNKVRVIRALEVAEFKRTSKKQKKAHTFTPRYSNGLRYPDVEWIGIEMPMKKLEIRIQKRLKSRMQSGMLREAKKLHADGLSYKRMEALGLEYRFMARLLQKKITRTEFDVKLFHEIRNYAKRQITYWKRNEEIKWIKK